MKNYPKPTRKDVARLIEGMIDDPRHEQHILKAIGDDDQLRACFDLLTSDMNFVETPDERSDDDLRAFVSATVGRIAKTRLLGIAWHDAPGGLAAGQLVRGYVSAFGTSSIGNATVPIELDGARVSEGQVTVSLGKMPVELVNLTAIDLGFAATRPKLVRKTLTPNFGKSVIRAWGSGRSARTVRLPRAEDSIRDDRYSLALESVSLAAHSANDLARALTVILKDDQIDISCTGDSTRPFELLVVEMKYPSDHPGFESGVVVAKPVILVREDDSEPGDDFRFENFAIELPTEASSREVEFTVRPAQPTDLRLLSIDQISTLLGQSQPRCLPLVRDSSSDRWSVRLDADELKLLTEPRFTWCVGVIPLEGTPTEGSIHASI